MTTKGKQAEQVVEGEYREVPAAPSTAIITRNDEERVLDSGIPALAIDHPVAKKLVRALRSKTPKDKIQKREGAGGKMLKYVPWAYVADRATQIWADTWSTEILSIQELAMPPLPGRNGGKARERVELLVHLRVITPRGKQEAFGSHTYYPSNAEQSKSDALQAATNKGLRRALARWGIALDLYFDTGEDEITSAVSTYELKDEWRDVVKRLNLTEKAAIGVLSKHYTGDIAGLSSMAELIEVGGSLENLIQALPQAVEAMGE